MQICFSSILQASSILVTLSAIGVICIVLYLLLQYKLIKLKPYNQSPLKIHTFDNNSPYHPSVLYFKDGWNGYKYWMAETPYKPYTKPYRDRYECPSIHVSQDGLHWEELSKGSNPIDDLDERGIRELDYFSDPHLVFKDNAIECWYRLTLRGGDADNHKNHIVIRKVTHDGINWSEREIVIKPGKYHPLGEMIISQALLYINGKYHIWYVNSENKQGRKLCYSNSDDGIRWTEYTECTLSKENANPWHIDVNVIDKELWLICYDFKDIHLYKGTSYTNFNHLKVLLTPSVFGSFYFNGLYRATMIKDKTYKLYFSADDSFRTFIGIMEGESPADLKVISPDDKKHASFLSLATQAVKWQRRRLFFYRNNIKKILKAK